MRRLSIFGTAKTITDKKLREILERIAGHIVTS